jgi:predicted acetyltransferase
LFKGAIGKDAVSRIWRKVKTDWEAWSKRRNRPAKAVFRLGRECGLSLHRC